MSKELFFLGKPAQFKAGILIYPPTLNDVVSNLNYSNFNRVLTYSQEEIEDIFVKEKKELKDLPTPIEFLLNNSYHNQDYARICKEAFKFFLKTEVEFLYDKKMILIGNLEDVLKGLRAIEDLVVITETEFFDFQNLIRLACDQKPVEPPNPNEHPKIKAMKAKARYRDKVKAKQNAKNGITLFTTMASICCMGIGLTPLNIGEMSYVSMQAILNMYQNKEKYQIDIDSLLAGADSKKIKPKYWISNLEE